MAVCRYTVSWESLSWADHKTQFNVISGYKYMWKYTEYLIWFCDVLKGHI